MLFDIAVFLRELWWIAEYFNPPNLFLFSRSIWTNPVHSVRHLGLQLLRIVCHYCVLFLFFVFALKIRKEPTNAFLMFSVCVVCVMCCRVFWVQSSCVKCYVSNIHTVYSSWSCAVPFPAAVTCVRSCVRANREECYVIKYLRERLSTSRCSVGFAFL